MPIESLHHRNFCTLFSDAIFFERASRVEADLITKNRFARASMRNSLLLLESAANCCMSCVDNINKALSEGLDRLSSLDKLDFFALHGYAKKIDYGRVEVQQIKEIKSIRDASVHPKVKKTSSGNEVEHARWFGVDRAQFCVVPKKSASGIMEYSSFWQHNDSFLCIKHTIDFFNYYFGELLGLDKSVVFGILNDAFFIDGEPQHTIYPPKLFDDIEYLGCHGIDVNFIEKSPPLKPIKDS